MAFELTRIKVIFINVLLLRFLFPAPTLTPTLLQNTNPIMLQRCYVADTLPLTYVATKYQPYRAQALLKLKSVELGAECKFAAGTLNKQFF